MYVAHTPHQPNITIQTVHEQYHTPCKYIETKAFFLLFTADEKRSEDHRHTHTHTQISFIHSLVHSISLALYLAHTHTHTLTSIQNHLQRYSGHRSAPGSLIRSVMY